MMSFSRDPFAVLGVARDADIGVIEDAYYNLVTLNDPEANDNGPEAYAELAQIEKAWNAIINAESDDEDVDEDEEMVDEEKAKYREKLAAAFDEVEYEWWKESDEHYGGNGYFVAELQTKYDGLFDIASGSVKRAILETTPFVLFRQDYFSEAIIELHLQRHKRHEAIKKRVELFQIMQKSKMRVDRLRAMLQSHACINEEERKAVAKNLDRACTIFQAHERGWMNLRRKHVAESRGNKWWYRYSSIDEDESYRAISRIRRRKLNHDKRRQEMKERSKRPKKKTEPSKQCSHSRRARRVTTGVCNCGVCAKRLDAETVVLKCLDCGLVMCEACHKKLVKN